jgi:hypothetical protein
VAKLVQIPAPRYKIGKGLPVGDVKRILAEAQRTRLYALYVWPPPSTSAAANSSACAGQTSTSSSAPSHRPRPFNGSTASF